MIPIIEFQHRASRGPVTAVDDFDLELAFKVRALVKKYEIKYDPEQLVVDDRTADAIFDAAVEHLSSVGVYFMSTTRVIQYDEQEIRQFAKESQQNPACVNLGKGSDRMQLRYRKGTDTWGPVNYGGPAGVDISIRSSPMCSPLPRSPRPRVLASFPGWRSSATSTRRRARCPKSQWHSGSRKRCARR